MELNKNKGANEARKTFKKKMFGIVKKRLTNVGSNSP